MAISVSDIRAAMSKLQRDIHQLKDSIKKTQDTLRKLDVDMRNIRRERVAGVIEQSVKPWKILKKERELYHDRRKYDELTRLERKYRDQLKHKKRDAESLRVLAIQAERGDEHALYQAKNILLHV